MATSKMHAEKLIDESRSDAPSSAVMDGICRQSPFRISPNVDGNFESGSWRSASVGLMDLLLEGAPLVLLTGAAGTGKTSLTLDLERRLSRWCKVVRARYSAMSSDDLFDLLHDGMPESDEAHDVPGGDGTGNPPEPGPAPTARATAPVLIIDDADLCEPAQLKRLLDRAGRSGSGVRLLLVGLPGLADLFHAGGIRSPSGTPDVVRFNLAPLSPAEVAAYVKIRLRRSGVTQVGVFSDAALDRIAEVSNGIPRVVNLVCSYAVLAAAAEQESQVGVERLAEVLEALKFSARVPPNDLPADVLADSGVDRAEPADVEAHPSGKAKGRLVAIDTAPSRRRLEPTLVADPAGPNGSSPPKATDKPTQSGRWQAWLIAAGIAYAVIVGGAAVLMPQLRGPGPVPVSEVVSAPETAGLREPASRSVVAEFGKFDEARIASASVTSAGPVAERARSSRRLDDAGVASVASTGGAGQAPMFITGRAEEPAEGATQSAAPGSDEPAVWIASGDGSSGRTDGVDAERASRVALIPPEPEAETVTSEGERMLVAALYSPAVPAWSGENLPTRSEATTPPALDPIEVQLELADAQIRNRRLTLPEGDSAFDTYRKILDEHPGNGPALLGMTRIRDQYAAWAESAVSRGELDKAERHYTRALQIDPTDGEILDALARLDDMSRLEPMAPERTPEPVGVVSTPSDVPSAGDPQPSARYTDGMMAVLEGDADRLRTELRAGFPPDARDPYDRPVLALAAAEGQSDLVRLLLEHGASVDGVAANGDTALMYAAWHGHPETALILMQAGADVGRVGGKGRTPLIHTAIGGYRDIAVQLLARGADIDAQSDDGKSALMAAVWNGHLPVARLLLANGAGVDLITVDGWSALMYAAWMGRQPFVQLLLDHGADPGVRNGKGQSVAELATVRGHQAIVAQFQ